MKIWQRLSNLWRRQEEDDMPCSIVLLLREPHFFSKKELEAAGERGWGKPFNGEADPMYFVVQSGAVTMVKAGSSLVHVLHAKQPYLDHIESVARQLPQEEQKRAWREHRAWAALDLMNKDQPKSEAYSILARFALQLGDSNCAAVYLPKDSVLMPNDGAAEEGLRLLLRKEPMR